MVPHVAHALWPELGYADAARRAARRAWPQVDEAALEQDEIELVLQINGKLRGALTVPADADKRRHRGHGAAQRDRSRSSPKARAPKKVIVVPGRLVNVVV